MPVHPQEGHQQSLAMLLPPSTAVPRPGAPRGAGCIACQCLDIPAVSCGTQRSGIDVACAGIGARAAPHAGAQVVGPADNPDGEAGATRVAAALVAQLASQHWHHAGVGGGSLFCPHCAGYSKSATVYKGCLKRVLSTTL